MRYVRYCSALGLANLLGFNITFVRSWRCAKISHAIRPNFWVFGMITLFFGTSNSKV